MKKSLKYINIIILVIGSILYFLNTFIFKIDMGSGHKELENIILLAIPCFMILSYSFLCDEDERKLPLILYLICYFMVVLGFVFSNNRFSVLVSNGIMDREINLIPFHSIIQLCNSSLGMKFAIYNIVGNFLMLTPLSILLPYINNKFKKFFPFVISIVLFCFFIEITQLLTGLGSFDIDDFILNTSGAIIFYVIFKCNLFNNLFNYIFFKLQISKIIVILIYVLLISVFIFVSIRRIDLILNYYQEQKIDFSNLNCYENKDIYIGEINNYKYYSKCDYKDSYIIGGKQQYKIYDFISSKYFNDDLINKLKLYREKIITNVYLIGNTNKRVLLYSDEYSNVYLYGFDELWIEKEGNRLNVKDELEKNNINISFIHTLVDLNQLKQNNGYSIETGDYYNILTCGNHYSVYSDFYILNKEYEITNNSCNLLSK